MIQVGNHQPFEMPLIQDDHVVQQVATATSHPTLSNTVGMSVQLHRMATLKFDVSE
jgi:hypothetical protein